MFNFRLAGDYTCMGNGCSLVMSLMVSYLVLSFFPRDTLDEIWD